jgi:uncharacterized protein (PEP-CTERM system associated)
LPAGLAAALLLVLPAAAQTTAPAEGGAPTPVISGKDAAGPAAVPALESPALGPLSGRDTPLVSRSLGGTRLGFATTAPGLSAYGIGTPLDLGNRPFAIRPSIGVDVLGTNNLFQTTFDTRSDIVTTIAPRLEAAIDTPRMSGALRYTPAVHLYGTYSNLDGVDQVGDGQLLAMLVPGMLFVDVRGSASVLAAQPGFIPGSGQFVAANNSLQTYLTQVTPFVVHRFGSAATLQVGYSFQYSDQGSADFSQSTPDNLSTNYTAHRGFAVLRSGEDLGRLALQARADDNWFVGNGIYAGAYSFFTALEARYAILPTIAALGEVGHENLAWSGTNPYSVNDAVWSAGVRLTPNRDSIVVIRYGHRYGFDSLSLNAGLALGVRTELFATYRETLNTSLTQGQDLLATTTTDVLGNPVDSQSGAPVLLINPFLGVFNTLYRMRIGTVALTYRWPRDVFTLSGSWQTQDPVSTASTALSVSSSNGTYATLNWTHELSPRTTGGATVQYGHVNFGQPSQVNFGQSGQGSFGQPGQGDQDTYALAATLAHQLSDKLTGNVQVAWTSNAASGFNQGYTQAVIRIGLRRTF